MWQRVIIIAGRRLLEDVLPGSSTRLIMQSLHEDVDTIAVLLMCMMQHARTNSGWLLPDCCL